MGARIFISYRTSDGVDKATALARELNAAFGPEQVFLDKEDLGAGALWRDAIQAAIGGKPVLLMLVTPQTFGPRIADANDPVRREIEAALAAGAQVIPLLADGVERLPDAAALPPSLQSLPERTWRRLRAYDWANDVQRLIGDLQALGIAPVAGAASQGASSHRRLLVLAGVAGLAAAGGAALWWRSNRRESLTAAAPSPSAAPAAPAPEPPPGTALGGVWVLAVAPAERPDGMPLTSVTLRVSQVAETVSFFSDPLVLANDDAWSGFAAHWKRLAGFALERLVLRGEGRVQFDANRPPVLKAALRFDAPGVGGDPIESGQMSVEVEDAITLRGVLRLKRDTQPRNALLMRSG